MRGEDARTNRSAAFIELRKRMEGRDRLLTDSPPANNAFVMRIGPLLIIEFGVTGNACYAFAASDFNADLDNLHRSLHVLREQISELSGLLQRVPMSKGNLRTEDLQSASTPPLKNLNDLLSGLKPFSESVKSSQQNGVTVTTAATVKGGNSLRAFTDADFQYLQMKCAQHGIELEDNRPKSGALWVLQRDRNKHFVLTNLLIRYGFQFAEGKGFWLKGGSK